MRKILAGLLSVVGFGNAGAQTPSPPPAEALAGLRSMVLGLAPGEIGLSPESYPGKVWGVVMETGLEGGFYTLVAMADGSTSLYFSTGGGILGGGEHERVREASRELLAVADRLASAAAPAAGTAPPGTGFTQFFLLTFEGLLSYSAPEVELGEQRDPLAPLFHAGHAVITQLRHVAP